LGISGRRQDAGGASAPVVGRIVGPTLWTILTRGPNHRRDLCAVDAVREDVLLNMNTVLNTRRGRCEGHPDFGMPDLHDFFASPRGLSALGKEIKRQVELWEPRVVHPVDVRIVTRRDGAGDAEGYCRATYVIRARLAAPWNELCTFRTTVLMDGPAEVVS